MNNSNVKRVVPFSPYMGVDRPYLLRYGESDKWEKAKRRLCAINAYLWLLLGWPTYGEKIMLNIDEKYWALKVYFLESAFFPF